MFGKLLGSRQMIDPNSCESNLVPSPSHCPAFRPTGYMLLFSMWSPDSVLQVDVSDNEMRIFRQPQMLKGCVLGKNKMHTIRQSDNIK